MIRREAWHIAFRNPRVVVSIIHDEMLPSPCLTGNRERVEGSNPILELLLHGSFVFPNDPPEPR